MRRSLKSLPALSKLLPSVRICWLSFLVRLRLLRHLSPKRKKHLLKLRKQQQKVQKQKLLLKRHLPLKKQPLKSSLQKKRKKKISLNFPHG